jgi:hypothetical protein
MPTFVMFDEAMNNIGSGVINLSTDTIKVVLTNGAPDQAAHDELADITQIANGNGYLTGGVTVAATWAETAGGSGVWRFDTADPSWTASGGAIAANQYAVWYSDTSTNDKLIGYVDRGASATVPDGTTRTFTVAAGCFDITVP